MFRHEVVRLRRIRLDVVELDDIVGGLHDQLIRPLDDAPLQLLVHGQPALLRSQRGRRIEDRGQ
jgi:hypothetical protein